MRPVQSHTRILETPASAGLSWEDERATKYAAHQLAAIPEVRNAIIELHGDLGAGKTTFARHLLRGLGVTGRIKSPTFAIVEPYELDGMSIWHFDFYRFSDRHEWEDAGFRDIFGQPGLKLVEWPHQAGNLLPIADLRIKLHAKTDSCRRVELEALTETGLAMLAALHPTAP